MNVPRARALRKEAREMLRGKWVGSFAAMLPMLIATALATDIIFILAPADSVYNTYSASTHKLLISGRTAALYLLLMFAAGMLLLPPLYVGVYRYMQRLHARREAPIGTVFEPFADCYRRSIGVYSVVALKFFGVILLCMTGLALLCMIGFLILTVTPYGTALIDSMKNGSLYFTKEWQIIAYIVILCMFIPAIAFLLKYMMVGNVLAENPRTKMRRCQKISRRLMTGNRWRFVRLCLSYIGWYVPVYAITYVAQIFLPWYVAQVIAVLASSQFYAYFYAGTVAFYEDLKLLPHGAGAEKEK